MGDDLERLCKRYEIAVGNFARSCISMRANEKSFQAWYASCVIQEFGLSRVYREVHLSKGSLFSMVEPQPLWRALEDGNELFPDLVVSWEPDVDVRHSKSRSEDLREAAAMLHRLAIVSELKVTGSTGLATSPKHIRQDLAKLAVFAAAHKAQVAPASETKEIVTYMVVLDNHCDDCGQAKAAYEGQRMSQLLAEVAESWPDGVAVPVVMLIAPHGNEAQVITYRAWNAGYPPPQTDSRYSKFFKAVAGEFDRFASEWKAGVPKAREMTIETSHKGIYYAWEVDKKKGGIWIDFNIYSGDPNLNARVLNHVRAEERRITEGMEIPLDIETTTKNKTAVGFYVDFPAEGDENTAAHRAADVMYKLMERTWPLVERARGEPVVANARPAPPIVEVSS